MAPNANIPPLLPRWTASPQYIILIYPLGVTCANFPWLHTEIRTEADLLPPGGEPGTVPTDLDQSTGLERLEILGKMQGIDIFDMSPLDASRRGTWVFSLWDGVGRRTHLGGLRVLWLQDFGLDAGKRRDEEKRYMKQRGYAHTRLWAHSGSIIV